MPDTQIAISEDVFLAAAKMHGEESEPDHEAGDLQEFFRASYRLLNPEQRAHVAADQSVLLHLNALKKKATAEADEEFYIEAAESFGQGSESELNALKQFFTVAFTQLDTAQRQSLIEDSWVQETLQNASGISDVEPNTAAAIYTAVAEHVSPSSLTFR